MNYYAIPLFVTFVLLLGEGYFVFRNNPKSKQNALFALFCLSLCVWLFCFGMMYLTRDEKWALFWARNGFFGIVFVPILAYHFVASFVGAKKDKILLGLYLSSIPSLLVFRTNLVYEKVVLHFWGYYPQAGKFYSVFLICFLVGFCCSVWRLMAALKKTDEPFTPQKQNQIKYLIFAFGIGTTGVIDYIGKFQSINIYPWGYISALFFVSLFGMAIVKYQLLEIEIFIRRTAVFTGLFAVLYGTFAMIAFIGQEFFTNTLKLQWNHWLAMIPTMMIITFAIKPLEKYLTNTTEAFLFQKKHNNRELLKTFTNEILTVLDLQELMDSTTEGLVRILKLESACILMFDKESKSYKIVSSNGINDSSIVFQSSDTIIMYLKATHTHILKDQSADQFSEDGALKEDFRKLSAQLCLPVMLHDELIGVLCLGNKKSGEEYEAEDIDILNTLARTEAIAISNAQLFDELSKTQAEAAQREKMAVIGTLAAGINHEICNPLGIVRGNCEMFLLNNRDGLYQGKSSEEILEITSNIMSKVIRETDRATSITKRLSSFAKPSKREQMEEVFAEKEVDEVLGLVEHDLKFNNIQIEKQFPQNFPKFFADKNQIQEVLFNIIRNAVQAMDKDQGRIEISGLAENGTAMIRIGDNGSGIPHEKTEQIFHPFYTTKAPGKGTGLGLFIVKQIVERNKGTISVESHLGVGTTFTLSFSAVKNEEVVKK